MPATINVPEKLNGDFRAFLTKENIALEPVTGAATEVAVVMGEERRECTSTALYHGGWIKCETARELKEKLSIEYKSVGKILDYLQIKVRQCDLGCF